MVVQGAEDTAFALAARRLARSDVKIVFDVHGDWHNNTRVYGSPGRRLLAPAADALARLAVRKADGVRTISGFTTGLVRAVGVEPTAEFPAYMDLAPFVETAPAPFPDRPVVLFVGVLERYKAVDILAAAWRRVVEAIPGAELQIVGRGTLQPLVERLVAESGGSVRWIERLSTTEVVEALDGATTLVLPSRGEGMGRVIVEAFCRGRPVVGTRSGGIPDLVEDGSNGMLVPTEDAASLANALISVLGDPGRAESLGRAAYASAGAWTATPAEFAQRMLALVQAVRDGSR
jgi:glycosyltransferase involved in cell wall biosynthesis